MDILYCIYRIMRILCHVLQCIYIGAKIAPGDSVLEQEVIAAVARVHAKTPAQVRYNNSSFY